jgi:O-antigen biosynthesis protein
MISIISPTHRPEWLEEAGASVKAQTYADWEWVIVPNGTMTHARVRQLVGHDPRIKVVAYTEPFRGIGALKKFSFGLGRGDVLVELDSDDLLAPYALEEVRRAFDESPNVGFVYSHCADFFADGSPSTYGLIGDANGWKYRDTVLDGRAYKEIIAFPPNAAAMASIFYAPNHVRCWRRDFYEKLGGHNPSYPVADDHELLIRTYLRGEMKCIPKLCYLYRMGANNTFAPRAAEIAALTRKLYVEYIDRLVARECELAKIPAVGLAAPDDILPGWVRYDVTDPQVLDQLRGRWPFEDSSVGAFRAFDFLMLLPDKEHTMREIHRCLRPGGWLLTWTPSTDGRGAFQDPRHVSYWNQNSFWYWTRADHALYRRPDGARFMGKRLVTEFPSNWHREHNIPYVTADLVSLKGDTSHVPGLRAEHPDAHGSVPGLLAPPRA